MTVAWESIMDETRDGLVELKRSLRQLRGGVLVIGLAGSIRARAGGSGLRRRWADSGLCEGKSP